MGRELEYEETKHNPAVKTEHQRRMKVIAKNNRQRSRSGKRKNS
jgi:hypothetical protein